MTLEAFPIADDGESGESYGSITLSTPEAIAAYIEDSLSDAMHNGYSRIDITVTP